LFLARIQIAQPLELRLAAGIERVELAGLNVLKEQQGPRRAELIVPIRRAVHDAYPCVVDIAALLRGQCRVPEPFRSNGASQMVVQISALGHGVEESVELRGRGRGFDLLEPALGRGARLHSAEVEAEQQDGKAS